MKEKLPNFVMSKYNTIPDWKIDAYGRGKTSWLLTKYRKYYVPSLTDLMSDCKIKLTHISRWFVVRND